MIRPLVAILSMILMAMPTLVFGLWCVTLVGGW